MGQEIELKYGLTEAAFSAVCSRFAPLRTITMETVYYDTPDRALDRRRWTLRRRYENGTAVCTMKTAAVEGSRGEWETECGEIADAVEPLIALGAPSELREICSAGLESTCGARFTRQAADIICGDARIELALDRGVLLGGGREEPLLELETELKAGSEEALRAFADGLAAEFALRPEPRSKFARARKLAEQR